MSVIQQHTFDYLKKLSENNNRTWFSEHKSDYEQSHENMIAFADALLTEMNAHDVIETPTGKKSLQRIYRDIRFSKDKTPYKKHWGGGLKRATALRRGGYYFHIEPNNTFVAGGFWGPSKEDLFHIRMQIEQDDTELRQIINQKEFQKNFGALLGDKLKTAPKGFDKAHPAIDLLRYKSYILKQDFTDQEVLSNDFYLKVNESFKAMRPFMNYMSDILTTNLNGELLEDIK